MFLMVDLALLIWALAVLEQVDIFAMGVLAYFVLSKGENAAHFTLAFSACPCTAAVTDLSSGS
jgi:hypothetical protein